MISPNQPSIRLSPPLTLGELQRKCDVMEGYVDLGLPEEAIEVMHKLTSELSLTDAEGEQLMNVLMKKNSPARPAVDETGHSTASHSHA